MQRSFKFSPILRSILCSGWCYEGVTIIRLLSLVVRSHFISIWAVVIRMTDIHFFEEDYSLSPQWMWSCLPFSMGITTPKVHIPLTRKMSGNWFPVSAYLSYSCCVPCLPVQVIFVFCGRSGNCTISSPEMFCIMVLRRSQFNLLSAICTELLCVWVKLEPAALSVLNPRPLWRTRLMVQILSLLQWKTQSAKIKETGNCFYRRWASNSLISLVTFQNSVVWTDWVAIVKSVCLAYHNIKHRNLSSICCRQVVFWTGLHLRYICTLHQI